MKNSKSFLDDMFANITTCLFELLIAQIASLMQMKCLSIVLESTVSELVA